jgi:hypothetical protein
LEEVVEELAALAECLAGEGEEVPLTDTFAVNLGPRIFHRAVRVR